MQQAHEDHTCIYDSVFGNSCEQNSDQLEDEADRVLKNNPNDGQSLYIIACSLNSQERSDEAAAVFEKLLSIHPEYPQRRDIEKFINEHKSRQ